MRAHIFFVVGLVGLCDCGTSFAPPREEAALIATPQTSTEVRAAIVRALADRKFHTTSEARHRIVAELGRKDKTMRVQVDYSRARYTIRLVDAQGYEERDEGGKKLVDSHVARTIDKLYSSIDVELARPAKERAKAEERQREYDMRMQESKTAQAQAEAQTSSAQLAQSQQPQSQQTDDDDDGVQQPAQQVQVQQVQQSGSVQSTCCVNGARYTCPSNAAFQQCMMLDASGCTAAGRCN
jgi:hypothetical protein